MKYTIQFKSTIFLLATLLSIGIFTGCGGSSTTDETGDTITSTAEDTQETTTSNPNNDVILQKGWYIKLTVQSDTLKDESTVFGYLEGASDGKDRYESEALSSSGLYTTIYHEDFGSTKYYRSDYRAYKATGEKSDRWMIKVNSGDVNADVTLSWNGITYVTKKSKGGFTEELKTQSPELSLMRLVDVETGDVISVEENDMQISFNMEGQKERTFQWILLSEGEPEQEVQPASARMAAQSLKSMTVQSIEAEELDFGFIPPSFEKR